jgi:hypothetical protein
LQEIPPAKKAEKYETKKICILRQNVKKGLHMLTCLLAHKNFVLNVSGVRLRNFCGKFQQLALRGTRPSEAAGLRTVGFGTARIEANFRMHEVPIRIHSSPGTD